MLSVADRAVVGKMIEDHREKLLRMLQWRIGTAPISAEAILQDSFVRALERYDRVKDRLQTTPYAWLYRLALDCLIEEWRRLYRRGLEAGGASAVFSSALVGVV